MKTVTKTVKELVEKDEYCPLNLSAIPNYMGINLCSVEAITWTKQDDGQLVNLTIHFIPAKDYDPNAKNAGADDLAAILD